MIGIYKITSPSNKIYIGQSINIDNTWKYRYFNINGCRKQPKIYNSLMAYYYPLLKKIKNIPWESKFEKDVNDENFGYSLLNGELKMLDI